MEEEILETIRETLRLTPETTNEKTPLEEVVQDSMDIVELIAVLSNKYNLTIQTQDMGKIKTIGDIVQYVATNQATSSEKQIGSSF